MIIMDQNNEEKTKSASGISLIGVIVEGIVVARDRSALFADLGPQGTGIIYGKEFYRAKDAIRNFKIGDKITAKIVELENEDGYRELSLQAASQDMNWQALREMKEKEEVITVKITGINKGGLLTSVNGIAAFLPVSQLSPENYPRVADSDKQKILKELQKFIGKNMEVKILDLLAQDQRLILSEKAKREEAIKKIISNYKVGDIVEGEITGIADFGAFIKFPHVHVDAPLKEDQASAEDVSEEKIDSADDNQKSSEQNHSVEGLIHISELDWQLVQNPANIVKIGQAVKAQIIDIKNSHVFLSLKSLKDNPWQEVEKKHKKGDVLRGKVISLNPFGAFVEVLPKIRGLCHVSEFKSQSDMEESLKAGEKYNFQILLIDPKEHRISLRLIRG